MKNESEATYFLLEDIFQNLKHGKQSNDEKKLKNSLNFLLTLSWEKLHSKPWKDVNSIWRDMYDVTI